MLKLNKDDVLRKRFQHIAIRDRAARALNRTCQEGRFAYICDKVHTPIFEEFKDLVLLFVYVDSYRNKICAASIYRIFSEKVLVRRTEKYGSLINVDPSHMVEFLQISAQNFLVPDIYHYTYDDVEVRIRREREARKYRYYS